MALATVIYSGSAGSFQPTTFNCESDGEALLFVSASAWSKTAESQIGLRISIDGSSYAILTHFCNPAATHFALTPVLVPVKLSFGQHTVTLIPINANTVVDMNDNLNIVLQY